MLVVTLMRARFSGRGAWCEALVMCLEAPADCIMALLPWHIVFGPPLSQVRFSSATF